MPSKKQYNLVHNDEYDTRIPLHSDEAFHRGIIFHAKFIGSMDVPRPTSRVEIVAAMRRIRYEFKAKGVKKKKVTLEVSVDGLKVTLRKKKKKQQWMDENRVFLMHHPIYRIFYVSHDSHDLKIFSYIARDSSSNTFKCNVFKSSKKSQAMRVVRTVGQAFEVCHKLSINNAGEERDRADKDHAVEDQTDCYEEQEDLLNEQRQASPSPLPKDISILGDTEDSVTEQTSVPCLLRSQDIAATTTASTSPVRQSPLGTVTSDCAGLLAGGELTALKHEIQLLRERLEQQSQQTRAAVAHARLLQDQLAAETTARVEAQARTHQLLVQNKELLEHIGALVGHLREQERISGAHVNSQSQMPGSGSTLQQSSGLPDLSNLGQCHRTTGGQSSPWELDPPSFSYRPYPTESLYSGLAATVPATSFSTLPASSSTDQLQLQAQLLEGLCNIASSHPYQRQCSPYASPSPYANLLLHRNGGMPATPSPAQLSASSMSLLANSFASSPIIQRHKPVDKIGSKVEDYLEHQSSNFIRPLPMNGGAIGKGGSNRKHEEVVSPMLLLDPAPRGKGSSLKDKQPSSESSSIVSSKTFDNPSSQNSRDEKKHLPTILRTSGPPPSRTTSARLPPRNELMSQVQRTTWARHTTK